MGQCLCRSPPCSRGSLYSSYVIKHGTPDLQYCNVLPGQLLIMVIHGRLIMAMMQNKPPL